jgi:hypothetical protein
MCIYSCQKLFFQIQKHEKINLDRKLHLQVNITILKFIIFCIQVTPCEFIPNLTIKF